MTLNIYFTYLMTSVFTLELLLKCLKVVSGKAYMKIHDVEKLFEDLPENYQEGILNESPKNAQGKFEGSNANRVFHEILSNIGGDFINTRYFFDSD